MADRRVAWCHARAPGLLLYCLAGPAGKRNGMCGIAGYLASGHRDGLGASLRRMAAVLSHRGPDDEGFLEAVTRDGERRVGLAHRRLSIIDLDTGHQPIGNEDGTVQIVFNGEIYNFPELRDELMRRDTLSARAPIPRPSCMPTRSGGRKCVTRFRGMFAFAIWDANRSSAAPGSPPATPGASPRAGSGFRVPVNEWFRDSMRGYPSDHLLGAGRGLATTIAAGTAPLSRRAYNGAAEPRELLWCLLSLEVWHRS